MMDEKEFENIVEVDKYNLDREAAIQPRIFWQYSKMLADAQSQLDELEAELKVSDAELDEDIRDDPESYGLVTKRGDLKNVTVESIKNTIVRSKEHIELTKKIRKKQSEIRLLFAAKDTLEQRRTSISNLVRLSEQNYFSKPTKRSDSKDDRSRFRSRKKE
jgi:hypothetical protein